MTRDLSLPAFKNSIAVAIIHQNIKICIGLPLKVPVTSFIKISGRIRKQCLLFDKTENSIKECIKHVSINRIMIGDRCTHHWFMDPQLFGRRVAQTGARNAETDTAKCPTLRRNRRDFTEFEIHPGEFSIGVGDRQPQ
jgi:hypothetical protein